MAFPPKGFSLRWYERFFDYEPFIDSFIVSVELAIATAVAGGLMGVPAALGLGVSFISLLIAHTVISVPHIIRTVAGVYRGISPDYEETAAVLGANRLQIFWHVTLPMIKPGIFAGMLFAMLIYIDNLPISFFFGSARTNTLPVVMLSYLEHQFDPSVAAASSIQLLVAVIGLFIVERIYGLDAMAPAT